MNFTSLKAQLTERDPSQRKSAAEQIGKLAKDKQLDRDLFKPLLALLEDSDAGVQKAASLALFWMAHNGVAVEDTLPAIIKQLDSQDEMIRHDMAGVIESFARKDFTDSSAVPKLIRNLSSENPHTRAATVYCLGTLRKKGIAGPDSLEEVNKLANDQDEGVRQAVQRTIR